MQSLSCCGHLHRPVGPEPVPYTVVKVILQCLTKLGKHRAHVFRHQVSKFSPWHDYSLTNLVVATQLLHPLVQER